MFFFVPMMKMTSNVTSVRVWPSTLDFLSILHLPWYPWLSSVFHTTSLTGRTMISMCCSLSSTWCGLRFSWRCGRDAALRWRTIGVRCVARKRLKNRGLDSTEHWALIQSQDERNRSTPAPGTCFEMLKNVCQFVCIIICIVLFMIHYIQKAGKLRK